MRSPVLIRKVPANGPGATIRHGIIGLRDSGRNQIAAHAGKMPVQEMKDGEWYKYTIGNFERYDQALELLKNCQVRKAFIVAFDSQNIKQDLKSVLKDTKQ